MRTYPALPILLIWLIVGALVVAVMMFARLRGRGFRDIVSASGTRRWPTLKKAVVLVMLGGLAIAWATVGIVPAALEVDGVTSQLEVRSAEVIQPTGAEPDLVLNVHLSAALPPMFLMAVSLDNDPQFDLVLDLSAGADQRVSMTWPNPSTGQHVLHYGVVCYGQADHNSYFHRFDRDAFWLQSSLKEAAFSLP
jgi:hypothetical protein